MVGTKVYGGYSSIFPPKDCAYTFSQKLTHLCIPDIASSGLYIKDIKGYLLMPLIIHRINHYFTCIIRVSMGHRKMNKTRSQFLSLSQHHLVQTSNLQKIWTINIFHFFKWRHRCLHRSNTDQIGSRSCSSNKFKLSHNFCNIFMSFIFKYLIRKLSQLCKLSLLIYYLSFSIYSLCEIKYSWKNGLQSIHNVHCSKVYFQVIFILSLFIVLYVWNLTSDTYDI